ncbi:MAG TPA: NAD(P)H-dependent glycerol-3-phosphate dehydrogenase [Methylocystis sp.]|nr:NAD(P)H-dependent glycerol-3-phosphate dehydrogenase [Methylocystis sp.]
MKSARVMVLGAGAWGTALANVAADGRTRVPLYGRDPAQVEALARDRENRRRLPNAPLAPPVAPTGDLGELREIDIALGTAPAQAMRDLVRHARPYLRSGAVFVICAKGIERETHKFLSEVVAEEAPQVEVAALSGPGFALDVCRGLPTAVTIAHAEPERARALAQELSTKSFRLYHSTDLRGVEIGGAAKNVLAIASGMAAGRELGASAAAALVARGFAELSRLGAALGARPETLMGLSGLGDLVLTCSSSQSRNFALGQALGRGEPVAQAGRGKLAEGAFTAAALVDIAREHGVEMPIAEAVNAILAGRIGVDDAIAALMTRPLRAEGA